MSFSGEQPGSPTHGIDAAEWRSFHTAQSILAITEYVKENQLAIDPTVIARRHQLAADPTAPTYNVDPSEQDPSAHKMRNDAIEAWLAPLSEGGLSLGDLFRWYWPEHKADIEAAIRDGQPARIALIEKIRGEELLVMSMQASEAALLFEVGLKDGGRWKDDAEQKIFAMLDGIASRLPELKIRSAFEYKNMIGVATRYLVDSADGITLADRLYEKLSAQQALAHGPLAKRLGQKDLPPDERKRLQEFRAILNDALSIFYNASDLVTGRTSSKSFS